MLELEKNSSKSTSVDDTTHSFTPTSNVRNGFRRKKRDSPFTYNLNLKVKKEKKQSNCTNPDPWARIVGSRNTAEVAIEVEAEVEVEEVQYYAIGVETSFLKNKLVIKWLNVPIRNKPKIAGGKISLVMFKGRQPLHN